MHCCTQALFKRTTSTGTGTSCSAGEGHSSLADLKSEDRSTLHQVCFSMCTLAGGPAVKCCMYCDPYSSDGIVRMLDAVVDAVHMSVHWFWQHHLLVLVLMWAQLPSAVHSSHLSYHTSRWHVSLELSHKLASTLNTADSIAALCRWC